MVGLFVLLCVVCGAAAMMAFAGRRIAAGLAEPAIRSDLTKETSTEESWQSMAVKVARTMFVSAGLYVAGAVVALIVGLLAGANAGFAVGAIALLPGFFYLAVNMRQARSLLEPR